MRMNSHDNTDTDKKRAQSLRNEATFPERLLWRTLTVQASARGMKFRRQHPLHPYIVDFVCLAARLAVELDGASHDATVAYDRQREEKLKGAGFTLLRFSNKDVATNVESVVETILNRAETLVREREMKGLRRAPLPNPPREGEGTGRRGGASGRREKKAKENEYARN